MKIKSTPLLLLISLWILCSCGKTEKLDATPPAPNPTPSSTLKEHPSAKSDVTDEQQSREMPLPGQANDHSTPDRDATQKSH